jgi:multidrug resistance efflux pump
MVITPTATVQRGQVDLSVSASGELRTPHVAMVIAPPVMGTLQIIKLAKTGTAVKAGDEILELNTSEQQYNLEQSQSRFAEAEQQIIKAKADAAVQAAQDKVVLMQARFDVRRAELEVGKNELVGEIDGEKNNLALKEAQRQLAQLEQDVASRQSSNNAGVTVLEQQREQARMQMQQAQRNIESMVVRSPIDGVVAVAENMDESGVFYRGMTLPEFREGDQLRSGEMIARVMDLGSLELAASVSDTERINVAEGAVAEVEVDAAPGRVYRAKVKSVAGMAARSMFGLNAGAKFEVVLEITNPDARLRPGASAQVKISKASAADVLYLPRECVFQKDGRPVVYVRDGNGFRAQEPRILNQSESRVVVEGLPRGTEIALLDPTIVPRQAGPGTPPGGAGGRL